MKKNRYIFLAIILIYTQMMQAQDIQSLINDAKIGVKGMLNLADMTVNPSHQIDTKILGGFGAFAQMSITDNISFQPELLFSLQGGVQHTFSDNFPDDEFVSDEKLSYLLVPLMGQYHFDQFYIEAGLQPAFLLSAKIHNQTLQNGKVILDYDMSITDQTNLFDLGFNIGAGYQINDKIYTGIRYSMGLLPINQYRKKATLKNSVISFSIGYVIFN